MNRGKLPTIMIIVAVLQKATRMRQIAIIERMVSEQISRTRIGDPWLLKPS
jgi:hypothetical protein